MSGTPSKTEVSPEEVQHAAYEKEREAKARLRLAKEKKASEQVEEFLKWVVEGEQDKAEAMLKEVPELTLKKGTVTDLSNREFKDITGFQYALWALDWHMWRMLLQYMDSEVAAEQLAELEAKGTAHGKHFSLEPLIGALNSYVKRYGGVTGLFKLGEEQYWWKEVGGAQLLLPVHVVNEYCHPTRSFVPCPEFKEESLPRSMKLYGEQGHWFTNEYNGGKLGEKFAIVRYTWEGAEGERSGRVLDDEARWAIADAVALQRLWEVRQQQLEALRVELRHLMAVKGLLNTYFPSSLSSTVLSYFG